MKLLSKIPFAAAMMAGVALPSSALAGEPVDTTEGTPAAATTGAAKPAADGHSLAQKAQNPIANMISLPFQSNVNFGVGDDDTQYINLIQPVLPQELNDDWNWIHRGIIPVPMYQPGVDDAWGLGDIQYEGFLSPSKPGELIWGLGPYLSFPTATDDVLGTEKWSAGPALVFMHIDGGPWVLGALFTQLWSFAGDSDRENVNQTAFQPIINYNIPNGKGWYLTSVPIWNFNWNADSGNTATIPLGGGVGRVFKIGEQAVNAKLQFFGYADAPENGPDWSIQLQFTLLFPK